MSPTFKTIITTASSDIEQRRALVTAPRYKFKYKWTQQNNDKSILSAMHDFYVARKGSYESFALFEFDCSFEWNIVNCGAWVNSGTMDIKSKNVKSGTHVIRVGSTTATPLTLTTHYTITNAGGTNGQDLLNMTSSQSGTVYHSWTGQRYFIVRFVEDSMDMTLLSAKLHDTGLDMIEAVGET